MDTTHTKVALSRKSQPLEHMSTDTRVVLRQISHPQLIAIVQVQGNKTKIEEKSKKLVVTMESRLVSREV